MVFSKLKNMINGTDEKYEVLYHKYSQSKSNNKKLIEEHEDKIQNIKDKVKEGVINQLIGIYEKVEEAQSFAKKVDCGNRDTQKLLISINAIENEMKSLFKKYNVKEYDVEEKEYCEDLHEIAAYKTVDEDIDNNLIVKTIKKGIKSGEKILRKPKVAITKQGIVNKL